MENYATEGQCILGTWYCARTTAGREQRLVEALNRLDVETFLPRFLKTTYRSVSRYHPITNERRYNREPVETKFARFPGYLFARLGDYEWAAVKTRLGVVVRPQWVKLAGTPVEVDPLFLAMLAAEQDKPLRAEIQIYQTYKQGDAVEILEGPFAGQTGLYSHSETERIMVMLSLLGRNPVVPFEYSQVQPLTVESY